jgi:hypothetical protein
MGFPSRRARTRASNRAPGEILIEEWKGGKAEKALVSIHPERFEDVTQVALSTLFIIGNEVFGSRRNLGSLNLGVVMNKENGDLGYTTDEKGHHAYNTLSAIVKRLGDIPEGFADMPEPTKRAQVNRQLKYSCPTCGTIVRSAGQGLESLCLHGGKPQYGQSPAKFALAPVTQRNAATEAAAQPQSTPAPAIAAAPVAAPAQARTARATRNTGANKTVGRNFGQATAAQAPA